MAEFNIRSDSIDVQQIMERIRARIREKRGVDYTEEQIRELAQVKLEKFLDPRVVRSDLLEHYRRGRPSGSQLPPPAELAAAPPLYGFDADTIYQSSRSAAGRIISLIRKLLRPILKLFFNPGPIIQVLHMQSVINTRSFEALESLRDWTERASRASTAASTAREEVDALNYEVLHNLVIEMTRLGIEVKNLKMRLESLSGRLDFDERRARALESVVQYRADSNALETHDRDVRDNGRAEAGPSDMSQAARRRRRRRRRGGGSGPRPSGAPEPAAGADAAQREASASSLPPGPAEEPSSDPSDQ